MLNARLGPHLKYGPIQTPPALKWLLLLLRRVGVTPPPQHCWASAAAGVVDPPQASKRSNCYIFNDNALVEGTCCRGVSTPPAPRAQPNCCCGDRGWGRFKRKAAAGDLPALGKSNCCCCKGGVTRCAYFSSSSNVAPVYSVNYIPSRICTNENVGGASGPGP